MGEPLNNYDAVLAAIRGMSDSRMFKLSPRHITLSTVGVVPRMKQLTIDAPETQLALSLHAPNQARAEGLFRLLRGSGSGSGRVMVGFTPVSSATIIPHCSGSMCCPRKERGYGA